MKNRLISLFVVLMLLCSSACAEPAVYTGEGSGLGGTLTVEMTVDGSIITGLQVTSHRETPGICEGAIEQIPSTIVEHQSLAADVFSGATVTSKAIIEAATAATVSAGLDLQALNKPVVQTAEATESTEQTADVIVIGAGGAGLAAAASAGENGASVIVLEAASIVGGSTIRSGGHMLVFDDAINASMDRNDEALKKYLDYKAEDFGEWAEPLLAAQEQIRAYLESDQVGRFDSVELAMVDHYIKGMGTDRDGNKVSLPYDLNRDGMMAADAINEWLISGGMEIQPKMYNAHGGTPVNGAKGMVDALMNLADAAGAKTLFNMKATELMMQDGTVVGVKAVDTTGTEHIFHANKGVVIATGSFSSNGEMAAKYQNIADGLFEGNGSSNPATNDGQGIVMAEAVGAQLRDMQFLCTMTGGINGVARATFAKTGGTQQLFVNADAVRFGDENNKKLYDGMNAGLINQPNARIYMVGDSKMIDALNAKEEGIVDTLVSGGAYFVADTLEEAATLAGLDAAKLAETVATFNTYVDNGADPDFGRTEFNGKVENGPFLVAVGEAIYHLTFGGLVINTDAEVIDVNGNTIPGLYAAGDVISGFEGVAHQSGDCLTLVLYYGKVAGAQAAQR